MMQRNWMQGHLRDSAFGAYSFGRTGLERFRRWVDERGFQYAEDFFAYPVSVPALAPGASSILKLNIERDSVFEWMMTAGGASTSASVAAAPLQGVDVQIASGDASRNLMNNPIPFANIVGTGANPFVLPIPRRFMPRTAVTLGFHNYTPGTTFEEINFTLIGRKIFEAALPGVYSPPVQRFNSWQVPQGNGPGTLYCEDLFHYDFPFLGSFAPGTKIISDVIEAISDFEWLLTTFSARNTRTGTILTGQASNFFVQVHDGTDNRDLFEQAAPMSDVAGDGQFPFVLRMPRIFLATSPIKVTLTNADADTFDNVHFTMIGRNIFTMH